MGLGPPGDSSNGAVRQIRDRDSAHPATTVRHHNSNHGVSRKASRPGRSVLPIRLLDAKLSPTVSNPSERFLQVLVRTPLRAAVVTARRCRSLVVLPRDA